MAYLIVILIMGFLILIHELGHFLSAKCLKIPIARFSIGFGPKLWACKKGETEYWISAFPLDGGKFLLYSLERISPKSLRLHASLNLVGWALMIGLMLYVNARDAINYILAAIQIA